MSPYDPALLAITAAVPQSIADVLASLNAIENICVDGDGLKWFNWLYLRVTQAVAAKTDPAGWIAQLDFRFARLYLSALGAYLAGASTPSCWRVLFENRDHTPLGRIQFAMCGINAHINHDLAEAIVNTCDATGVRATHSCPQYADYTALNSTLDAQIDTARHTLHVRLLGDVLPPVSQLEDTLAAWSISAARELAWQNAEHLGYLRGMPEMQSGFLDMLDGFTTVIGKTLMIPVP
jgi:hypothetical protein